MTQQFVIQGRIVWGHPSKPRIKKDVRTKQPIIKDGKQVHQYVFGVAIDKNTFNQQVWPAFYNEARAAFPNGIPSNFSYKFKDGDGVDSKGQPFNLKEGYAGHCVVTISTEGFAPQVFKNENGVYRQLAENEVKCGDFVAVNITIKYNGAVSPNTPGLYVNPNGVVHIGYGQEIVSSGQDPDELFAGYQPQQFAGMSATPVMSNAPMPTAMHPTPPATSGYVQSAPQYGAPPPANLPPPARDFVQNAVAGAPPAAYPANPTGMPMAHAPAAMPPSAYPAQPMQPGYGVPPSNPPAPQYGAPPAAPPQPYGAPPSGGTPPAQPMPYPGLPPGR